MAFAISAVEAPKLLKFRYVNGNERTPLTRLPVTVCVFGSPYAFHLIAEGLTVCPFSGSFFVRLVSGIVVPFTDVFIVVF